MIFIQKTKLLPVGDFSDYELATDAKSVIESMIDCIETYGPEYMHGRHKSEYLDAARECLFNGVQAHG